MLGGDVDGKSAPLRLVDFMLLKGVGDSGEISGHGC